MACDFLIPQQEMDSFMDRVRPHYSNVNIEQFAERMKVHPGIILGQLQQREEIGQQSSREILVKVRETATSAILSDGFGSIAGYNQMNRVNKPKRRIAGSRQ